MFQHLQNHEALRDRRLLVNREVAIRRPEWLQPLGVFSLKIFLLDDCAFLIKRSAHSLRRLARIESVPALLRNQLQCIREAFLHENSPRLDRVQNFPVVAVHRRMSGAELLDPRA